MTALFWLMMLVATSAPGTPLIPGCAPDSLRVPILVYHNVTPLPPDASRALREFNVSPDQFEWQMAHLRAQGIGVVSLDALIDARLGRGRIDGPAVVIAFDDGWLGQYQYAFPVLRRFGYSATFFNFTNPIGRNARWMTWDQLRELCDVWTLRSVHVTEDSARFRKIVEPRVRRGGA